MGLPCCAVPRKKQFEIARRTRARCSLEQFWAALGRRWAAFGHLLGGSGWLLGGSWAALGRPWGGSGGLLEAFRVFAVAPTRNLKHVRFFKVFGTLGPLWESSGGLLGGSWQLLAALGRLLAALGGSGAALGLLWGGF